MEKKTKIIIASTILLALIIVTIVYAASTDPARFGDGTTTTVLLGGTTGNITADGIIYTDTNISYNSSIARGTGTVRSFTANACKEVANSTGVYITC